MPVKGEKVGDCRVCGGPVLHPRRDYCSARCSIVMARRKSSASLKANHPGVRDYDPAMRNCLCCGEDFMSSSKSNRICVRCKKNQPASAPMRTPPGCKADEE